MRNKNTEIRNMNIFFYFSIVMTFWIADKIRFLQCIQQNPICIFSNMNNGVRLALVMYVRLEYFLIWERRIFASQFAYVIIWHHKLSNVIKVVSCHQMTIRIILAQHDKCCFAAMRYFIFSCKCQNLIYCDVPNRTQK